MVAIRKGLAALCWLTMCALLLPTVSASITGSASGVLLPDDSTLTWIDPGESSRVSRQCQEHDIFYGELSLRTEGAIDFFICDEANFDQWADGHPAVVFGNTTGVTSHSWKFQVPHDGRWIAVFANTDSGITVRVWASFYSVSSSAILVRNAIVVAELAVFIAVGVASVMMVRSRYWTPDSLRADSDPAQKREVPYGRLLRFGRGLGGVLVVQSASIAVCLFLVIAERWNPEDSLNGLNLLGVVYLFPLLVPLYAARRLMQRKRCGRHLLLWYLACMFFGNFYLWAWFASGGYGSSIILVWVLSYLLPSWLVLAYLGMTLIYPLGFFSGTSSAVSSA